MSNEPLLTVRGLSVSYGGVVAVSDVHLDVARGELVGLIGPNGAGKTTTIDAICGFVGHGGRVEFEGSDLSAAAPHVRARAGIARTWQSVELFDDLDIARNCEVAAQSGSVRATLADVFVPRRRGASESVARALDIVGLTKEAQLLPTELPLGRRKLAGVARALAAEPSLLLLDEPAAGLDSTESLDLGRRIKDLVVDQNIGGLLIDHDTRLVFEVCDRIYVLDFGVVIASGTSEEVRIDERVVDAYLGGAEVDR